MSVPDYRSRALRCDDCYMSIDHEYVEITAYPSPKDSPSTRFSTNEETGRSLQRPPERRRGGAEVVNPDGPYNTFPSVCWPQSYPQNVLLSFPVNTSGTTAPTAPQPVASNLDAATTPQPELQRPQTQALRRLLPVVPNGPREKEAEPEVSRKDKTAPGTSVVSPFTADEDRLVVSVFPRFNRPPNGRVNGYVKFNWPTQQDLSQPPAPAPVQSDDDVEDITPHISRSHPGRRNSSNSNILHFETPMLATYQVQNRKASTMNVQLIVPGGTPSQLMMPNSPLSPQEVFTQPPQKPPVQFGYEVAMANMDYLDRRLFEFYIKNWCPGRSVLQNTNLWLKDLAPMGSNQGILHAIQSLAGVYIYDYLPDERIRQRVNQRYAMAKEYFNELLSAPESRTRGERREVITMAVLLSMQDIILTERRLKKPAKARWLEGFKQGEYFLQQTDPGRRFWKDQNTDTTQYDPLRISQSIIVGRAVILAQPMMALPEPESMNPETEANRFNWLLYGTESDLFEIHGGCGFSKKLLHTMSQVTYCAARLHQEPETTIVPITAKFLLRTLTDMRQWSREGKSWEECRQHPQTITWVRDTADDVIISSKEDMTDVTAEAWRIAAIIYYQCRLLRLPRNHPDVLANMDDLAKCIRIMPTSGSYFTAQAPLLPVFFLGLLATSPAHEEVSRGWFEDVVNKPVRSSVPPLYEALKRIWKWIDSDVNLQREPTPVPESLSQRYPWWEYLVQRVLDEEDETLCLT